MQASVGMVIIALCLAFLNDFHIIKLKQYITISDAVVMLVVLQVTCISCAFIIRDASFDVVSGKQIKLCLYVFTILALTLGVLTIYDMAQGEASTLINMSCLVMSNSIRISLWLKRKSW